MTSVHTRVAAAVAPAVLVAAGQCLVPSAAVAASGTILYDCSMAPGPSPIVAFAATIDSDAPATLGTGVTRPLGLTATVQIPEAVADALRAAGATSVTGTALASGTVDGVERQLTLTIPSTPVPADGVPMQVVGSGPAGTITGGPVGAVIDLDAGDFAPTFTAYNSGGGAIATAQFLCGLQPSQNLHVDSVETVKAGTRANLTAPYRAAKDKIVARTEVSSASFADTTGQVRYVLKRNGVKVRTATVALNDNDVAKLVFGNISRRGTYVVIARYSGSPTMKQSEDRVRFTI